MKERDEFQPEFQLPEGARQAFEAYPKVEPSPAFNRAVIESLQAAQSRRRSTLLGRLEEFLGLNLWQFAATGMMGALLPTLLLGALWLSNRPQAPVTEQKHTPTQNLGSNIGPLYARELLPDVEVPRLQRKAHPKPTRGGEFSCVFSARALA